jgi:hypothetical protein
MIRRKVALSAALRVVLAIADFQLFVQIANSYFYQAPVIEL